MNLSSNSWGYPLTFYEVVDYANLVYLSLATPGFFHDEYPGMLFLFSQGNTGPGYGTASPPQGPQILNIGATTSGHAWVDSYGPDQDYDQLAHFSSRGATDWGYPKPDILSPGAYGWSTTPSYGGLFWDADLYQDFGGTSMACPIAAGVAAQLMEYGGAMHPEYYKTVICSTAKDLGMEPMAQGHGRIDAVAAMDYLAGTSGIRWYTEDSAENYADVIEEAWMDYMNPSDSDILINETTPVSEFQDSSLFYGWLQRGEEASIALYGTMYDESVVELTDYDWDAKYWVEDTTYTLEWTTWIYNESVSMGHNTTKGGYFELDDELGADYADFAAAPFASIYLGGETSDFGFTGDLWSFIFDWEDKNVNGVPDYYNTSTEEGDELTRLQFGGASWGNVLKMDLNHMDGIGNLFPNTPIVMVHDDTIWDDFAADGHDLNVTITTWQLVDDTQFTFTQGDNDEILVNVTVDAEAQYGCHSGFIWVHDGGSVKKLPYTYVVYPTLEDADGSAFTIIEGVGDELTPYEPGAIQLPFGTYRSSANGDRKRFVIEIDNTSAAYLGARIEWAQDDTELYIAIATAGYDPAYIAETGGLGALTLTGTSVGCILELPESPNGMYIVWVGANVLDGEVLPEEYNLTLMLYEELTDVAPIISYTALDVTTPVLLADGDTAVGDHCVMNVSYPEFNLPNMPEYEVVDTTMSFLAGILETRTGDNVDPGGFDQWPIPMSETDHFIWEGFHGVPAGANVEVYLDIPHNDPSFDVYQWIDANEDNVVTNDEITGGVLLSVDDGGSDYPESGSFAATVDMSIAIRVFNWAWAYEPAEYFLEVDARVGLDVHKAGAEVTYDTYDFSANATRQISIVALTSTNINFRVELAALSFANYFAPVADNVEVSGTGAVKTIEWEYSDKNSGDDHYSEVYYSTDGGDTFQFLAANLTETSFEWDSTGFLATDYIVRIRVIDNDPGENPEAGPGDYWPGLYSTALSESFSAGTETLPETTTTTTTEETTTTTEEPPPETIDPLIIGLVGGIGAGIVVVLILFLVKKK
jgi:hypothetical protein